MSPCRYSVVSPYTLLLVIILAGLANVGLGGTELTSQTVSPTVTCSILEADEDLPLRLECNGLHFSRSKGHHTIDDGEVRLKIGSTEWLFYFGCALFCVICAALAAGLTLGLTSIEEFEMRVLCNHKVDEVALGAPPHVRLEAQQKLVYDQKCAHRILPHISGHFFRTSEDSCAHGLDPSNSHYLLVTLLLANATANEALPLFLDQLVPSWLACILSVTVVLFFGEIIPSAIFTGPRQLSIAAKLSPVVSAAKHLFVPIVWPISLLLDKLLGHEEEGHSRAHIKALIRTIRKEDSCLEIDEANMIHGVLEMHHKKAFHVAHPLRKAKMLPHDRVITAECVEDIMRWGHSRLFVYRRDPLYPEKQDDIIGVVLVKKLLNVSHESQSTVDSVVHALKLPIVLSPLENLLTTLNKFQSGTCHLAIISADPDTCLKAMLDGVPIPDAARPTMFCSLEDVIEEMLKEEIYDEEDRELGRHQSFPSEQERTAVDYRKIHFRLFARRSSSHNDMRNHIAEQYSKQRSRSVPRLDLRECLLAAENYIAEEEAETPWFAGQSNVTRVSSCRSSP